MLQYNTMRYGTDELSFKKSSLLTPKTPFNSVLKCLVWSEDWLAKLAGNSCFGSCIFSHLKKFFLIVN